MNNKLILKLLSSKLAEDRNILASIMKDDGDLFNVLYICNLLYFETDIFNYNFFADVIYDIGEKFGYSKSEIYNIDEILGDIIMTRIRFSGNTDIWEIINELE